MKGVITVTPRESFSAIQVNKDFAKIAKWCGGEIVWEPTGHKFAYIRVGINNDAYDYAYRGYWIVMQWGEVVVVCDDARFHTAWKELT